MGTTRRPVASNAGLTGKLAPVDQHHGWDAARRATTDLVPVMVRALQWRKTLSCVRRHSPPKPRKCSVDGWSEQQVVGVPRIVAVAVAVAQSSSVSCYIEFSGGHRGLTLARTRVRRLFPLTSCRLSRHVFIREKTPREGRAQDREGEWLLHHTLYTLHYHNTTLLLLSNCYPPSYLLTTCRARRQDRKPGQAEAK